MQYLKKYFAISEEILCNIQQNIGEYFDKYNATAKEILFQISWNTVKYEKKYCAIFEEILCNIQRNTVEYLRSVVTCSVGGDRNVTRERDAAHRPITAGLLVWHNFYLIFYIVSQVIFPPLNVTFPRCNPQGLERTAYTVHTSILVN